MSALHRFEQRLESLVTGAFARAFRSAVQPMEIAAALQREVDNSAQILSRDKRLAPNDFLIDLSPTDFDRLSAYGETLSGELAQMLHEHADEQRYLFAGAIQLKFQRIDELTTGRFRVRSSAAADVTPGPSQPTTDTAVRRALATLELNGATHPIPLAGLVIGRGSQSDLRIDDPGVSRRHAQVRVEGSDEAPLVSIIDLGSTNGVLVDGKRVQHAILDDGATIRLGSTTMRMHLAEAATTAAPVSAPPYDAARAPISYPPYMQQPPTPPEGATPTGGAEAAPRSW